jgi:UDP-N-acetylglucosamine 2-epimerase (non-hydrolysing)
VYAAQHRETFSQTLEFFNLPAPDYVIVKWNTEAKTISKALYWLMRMLLALPRSKKILAGKTGKQHIVLTHGDTTTTFIGALIGRVTRTHVMHVESGLRSFHLFNPFQKKLIV